MSDPTTEATRANDSIHRDELKAGLLAVLDALTRMQQHARTTDKAKWQRLQTRAHRLNNACDRVLVGLSELPE